MKTSSINIQKNSYDDLLNYIAADIYTVLDGNSSREENCEIKMFINYRNCYTFIYENIFNEN